MTEEEIDSIIIEHRGMPRFWNITMTVVPLRGNSGKVPCYADLVETAEDILRKTKGLGSEWIASNAEVRAWSSQTSQDGRGILVPDRFRVTLDLDMESKDMEKGNENDHGDLSVATVGNLEAGHQCVTR